MEIVAGTRPTCPFFCPLPTSVSPRSAGKRMDGAGHRFFFLCASAYRPGLKRCPGGKSSLVGGSGKFRSKILDGILASLTRMPHIFSFSSVPPEKCKPGPSCGFPVPCYEGKIVDDKEEFGALNGENRANLWGARREPFRSMGDFPNLTCAHETPRFG